MPKGSFVAVAIAVAVGATSPALAQQAPVAAAGKVTAISGPPNSVLVIRGNTTYALNVGDLLFPDDLVFTRIKGALTVALEGCVRDLPNAASLALSADACTAPIAQLAATDVVGGYAVTPPLAVSAAPQLVGLGITAASAAALSAQADQAQPELQPVSP